MRLPGLTLLMLVAELETAPRAAAAGDSPCAFARVLASAGRDAPAVHAAATPARGASLEASADPLDRDLARVVADYTGLYRRDALPQWRELFLPGFVAGSPRPDGSILQRSLDEFYEAQRRYFETGRAIRETLEGVRVERHGRLASVWADFVLEEEGERSRGRLVLSLIASDGRFHIHSLLFAYEP